MGKTAWLETGERQKEDCLIYSQAVPDKNDHVAH
jgi:hypothetical protein